MLKTKEKSSEFEFAETINKQAAELDKRYEGVHSLKDLKQVKAEQIATPKILKDYFRKENDFSPEKIKNLKFKPVNQENLATEDYVDGAKNEDNSFKLWRQQGHVVEPPIDVFEAPKAFFSGLNIKIGDEAKLGNTLYRVIDIVDDRVKLNRVIQTTGK